ncbi:MAG: orotidine-5'-phosphate decarboxylase [Oscillospiraceae bacterium]|nr:orotidine-5'-phosphate decarboxylase [Oscillospiraceae bacterium]
MSFDRLIDRIVELKNPTVAGLDPLYSYIPDYIKAKYDHIEDPLEAASKAVLEYNCALIDALHDIVPAVKPQAAYYEIYGWYGMKTFAETISYAKQKGMYVIADGKRNDIGSTMGAYAMAHLGEIEIRGQKIEPFGADALTVNGYLGTDGIDPLLPICKEKDKGIFVLVKTSNPSSGELQDKKMYGRPANTVYELMGDMCEKWGEAAPGVKYGYSSVGAVVGATYPEQLAELRQRLPHTFFLVPGYGAQGGGAAGVAKGFDENGLGAIVNSSRAILCAWQKEKCDERDFAGAARREAIRMREDIVSHINLK